MSTRPDIKPVYTVANFMWLTNLGREKVKLVMREGS